MIDLIKFLLADPETDKASVRKIIAMICALGLLVGFVKILMGTASPEMVEKVWTIVLMVIAFYFGKSSGNNKL